MANEPLLQDAPPMAGKTLYQEIKDLPIPQMEPAVLAELEELRGCPITFTDIHHIPCTEASDETVRQIEPLVSVFMLAYNHEKFIRQAIEGVVNQETNFPFELVIGEDCSTDKTREIVFEYQKKYPQIIRVLISEKNLTQNGSSNGRRAVLSCRGKFIAACEGDDYWTDAKKLQKQIDFLNDNPEVGVVCASYRIYEQNISMFKKKFGLAFKKSVRPASEILSVPEINFNVGTLTSCYRKECYLKGLRENRFLFARLSLGDLNLWFEFLRQGVSFGYLKDVVAVYRRHDGGATAFGNKGCVARDAEIVKYYYNQTLKIGSDSCQIKRKALKYRYVCAVKNNDYNALQLAINYGIQNALFSNFYGKCLKLMAPTRIFSSCCRNILLVEYILKSFKRKFLKKLYYTD